MYSKIKIQIIKNMYSNIYSEYFFEKLFGISFVINLKQFLPKTPNNL